MISNDTTDKQETTMEPTPEEMYEQETRGAETIPDKTDTKPIEPEAPVPENKTPAYNREAILKARNIAKLDKERRELQAELDVLREKYNPLEQAKSRLSDPSTSYAERIQLARQLGVDIDAINESFIRENTKSDIKEKTTIDSKIIRDLEEIKKFKADQEARIAEEAKAKAVAEEKAQMDVFCANAHKYVDDSVDKYPLIHAMGRSADIVYEIDRMEKNGELDPSMTIDDVAAKIETNIENVLELQLKILLNVAKFTSLYEKIMKDNKPAKKPTLGKTLNNKMAGTPKDSFDYSKATPAEIERYAREALDE